ncbi:MAG: J domain-containing protein [Terracidiphilus sp.]
MGAPTVDYYEFLQISPNADAETIHRVYRFLAARLHPDNSETGHEENFRLLRIAYDVLADPRRRSEYDATRSRSQAPPEPLATTIDFMDELDGELNRRLAVLAVLYYRRRTNPTFPEVNLQEIEQRMGFPRDYLDFTLWYLQRKGYVSKADNAQYTLTVDGVDFVETQRGNIPTLNKLLTSGSGSSVEDLSKVRHSEADVAPEENVAPEANFAPTQTNPALPRPIFNRPDPRNQAQQAPRNSVPIILPASMSQEEDRRLGRPDRRIGKPDFRSKKVERRFHLKDRREMPQTKPITEKPLLASGDS